MPQRQGCVQIPVQCGEKTADNCAADRAPGSQDGTVNCILRLVQLGPKVDQNGTKWDKSGIFKDLISVHFCTHLTLRKIAI